MTDAQNESEAPRNVAEEALYQASLAINGKLPDALVNNNVAHCDNPRLDPPLPSAQKAVCDAARDVKAERGGRGQ